MQLNESNLTLPAPDLYHSFWELNFKHFAGILPVLELKYSNRLKTTGGQYFRRPERKIQISTRYFEMPNRDHEIINTLGHEMVHYWLDFLGRPCGHTREFNYKLNECGFDRYSRLTPPNARYLYACPSCKIQYHRRKKGTWSCGPCSGKKFDFRFKLELIIHR